MKGNNISDELKNKGMVLNFSSGKGFTATGETVTFGEQDCSAGVKRECDVNLEVIALYDDLKSYQKVAAVMKQRGHRMDKNKVGRILKMNRPSVPNTNENSRTDEIIINNCKQVEDGNSIG